MPESKKKTVSYSKRMATKKHFVVLKGTNVLGVFSTLRGACKFLSDKNFPSYWTVVRSDNWKNGRRGIKRYIPEQSEYSIQQAPHKYSA